MNKKLDVSIVVPIYNEEDSIIPMYDAVRKVGQTINLRYELIFVDDGSNDQSFDRLRELRQTQLTA